MSDHIEWLTTAAPITFTDEPGAWVDGHGSSNDGPALAFDGGSESVVVEGTVEELRGWLTRALALLPSPAPVAEVEGQLDVYDVLEAHP